MWLQCIVLQWPPTAGVTSVGHHTAVPMSGCCWSVIGGEKKSTLSPLRFLCTWRGSNLSGRRERSKHKTTEATRSRDQTLCLSYTCKQWTPIAASPCSSPANCTITHKYRCRSNCLSPYWTRLFPSPWSEHRYLYQKTVCLLCTTEMESEVLQPIAAIGGVWFLLGK